MAQKKILVTDKVHPLLLNGLEKMDFQVNYHPKMPYAEVKSIAGDYHGIIINSKVICDNAFLTQHRHLEFIGRLGSGLDIIDLPRAAALGIRVINSPEGNANAVAEHTIGMLLSTINNLQRANTQVKNWKWNREPNRGIELEKRTIGILGCGHTGGKVATKLQTWDMNIIAYDKYREDMDTAFPWVRSVDLETLLGESDILTVHLPLTAETRMWLSTDFFSKCKDGLIFINTSRGPIVDTAALVRALQSEKISAACLDVLENEKLDELTDVRQATYDQLFAMPNVMLTPHVAGWTQESLVKIAQYLLDKIGRFYENQ